MGVNLAQHEARHSRGRGPVRESQSARPRGEGAACVRSITFALVFLRLSRTGSRLVPDCGAGALHRRCEPTEEAGAQHRERDEVPRGEERGWDTPASSASAFCWAGPWPGGWEVSPCAAGAPGPGNVPRLLCSYQGQLRGSERLSRGGSWSSWPENLARRVWQGIRGLLPASEVNAVTPIDR